MPITMQSAMATTPRIVETAMEALRRYTIKPKTMAIMINNKDTIATDALVAEAALSIAPASSTTAPKVVATIDANAATTRIRVRYAKIVNSIFALLLILLEIISPMDCPL